MNINDIDKLSDKEISAIKKLELKMDYERLILERRKTWITAVSIFIPLVLGVSTIFYSIWSENQRSVSAFEIKAVEIVMNASSPPAAVNKAAVLHELFPDRLPKSFKEKMETMYRAQKQDHSLK